MGIYLVQNYKKDKKGRWQNKNGVDVSILPIK